MPDKEGPDRGNGQPHPDLPAETVGQVDENQQPALPPLKQTADSQEQNPNQVERDIRTGEKWLVGIGIVSVLVNFFIAWIYLGQLHQMRTATEDTTHALHLAEDSATTENSHFDRTMRQVISQTAATEQAAIEAKEQAEIADETLRKSQRPWVNAESFSVITLTLPPRGRFNVQGEVTLKNTGTSVATEGWVMLVAAPNSTKWLTKNWDQACRIDDRQMRASRASAAKGLGDTWPIGFVLAPDQETKMRMASGDANGLITNQIERAESLPSYLSAPGQSATSGQFYLLGCARYRDQFGTHHITRFCFVYLDDQMSPAGFYVCNGNQTAN